RHRQPVPAIRAPPFRWRTSRRELCHPAPASSLSRNPSPVREPSQSPSAAPTHRTPIAASGIPSGSSLRDRLDDGVAMALSSVGPLPLLVKPQAPPNENLRTGARAARLELAVDGNVLLSHVQIPEVVDLGDESAAGRSE